MVTGMRRTFYSADENASIRQRLLDTVRAKGWSQAEASAALGMPQQRISGVLRGAHGSTPAMVKALAAYLEIPEAVVLGRPGADPGVRLRDLPGWDAVVAQARQSAPLPACAYNAVGAWPAGTFPQINPGAIASAAQAWWLSLADAQRDVHLSEWASARAAADTTAGQDPATGAASGVRARLEPEVTAAPSSDTSAPRLGRPRVWANKTG